MSIHHFAAASATAALLCVSAPARADTTPSTTISQITVTAPSSKRHRLFHGAIWLDFDKEKVNYRWGGAQCGGAGLSEMQVSMLYAAFRAKDSVNVDYDEVSYKSNRYRCVTGFTLRRG